MKLHRKDPLLTQSALVKRFRKGIVKAYKLADKTVEGDKKYKSWLKYLNSHIITDTRPWV